MVALAVDIEKSFGDFHLKVQFEAEKEILALLGASGCGKSMTLKCIAGVEKPDRGRIVLGDRVLFDSERRINLSPQKRRVGYLFQNYALFPTMTVEENIAAGISRSKHEKAAIIAQKVAAFYLQGLEKRYPSQLSGGQQQRVALARIFASEPEILMLDEPFSALDNHLKWQVEQELTAVLEQFSGTTLFVSHNRDEVYRICDRIAVLAQGHLDSVREKWDMFDDPQTLAASLLTCCKNHSRARKCGDYSVEALDWQITLETATLVPDDVQYVGVRAHFLAPPVIGDGHSSVVNRFQCQIERVIEDTSGFIVMFKNNGQGKAIRWEADKALWQQVYAQQGLNLTLSIAPEKILLLKG